MLDFPSYPVVGDLVTTVNGTQWRWNGSEWDLITVGVPVVGANTSAVWDDPVNAPVWDDPIVTVWS